MDFRWSLSLAVTALLLFARSGNAMQVDILPNAKPNEPEFRYEAFKLSNKNAQDLQRAFSVIEGVKNVIFFDTTNSLIVYGNKQGMDNIRSLVALLDRGVITAPKERFRFIMAGQ